MKLSVILIKDYISNEHQIEKFNQMIQRGLIEFCLYTLLNTEDFNLIVNSIKI
jgi:hypothetical protein